MVGESRAPTKTCAQRAAALLQGRSWSGVGGLAVVPRSIGLQLADADGEKRAAGPGVLPACLELEVEGTPHGQPNPSQASKTPQRQRLRQSLRNRDTSRQARASGQSRRIVEKPLTPAGVLTTLSAMSKVDQFESVFRSASKAVYHLDPPSIRSVLLVTDLPVAAADQLAYRTRQFLAVLGEAEWQRVGAGEFGNVAELLGQVEQHKPDLVVTYRHLCSDAWKWPFSLGEYLDVLTQAAGSPVLVLPHPTEGGAMEHALTNTDAVMAITDHLTGDDRLVNWSARFTAPGGQLYLSHVENQNQFERLLGTIGKIPSIDTDVARESILAQLLKEPSDYIESCKGVLDAAELSLTVQAVVMIGHHLEEYKKLIEEHAVDLLVMNTKDEYQAAMHGLAYPLAVEIRSIPLLLL